MCVTISSIRTADEFDDIVLSIDLVELSGDYATHRKYFDTAVFIINFINVNVDVLDSDTELSSLLTIHSFINELDKTILAKYIENLIMFD